MTNDSAKLALDDTRSSSITSPNGVRDQVAAILTFSRLILSDVLGHRGTQEHARIHLDCAIDWLLRAHDRTGRGGVSYGYSIRGGWRDSYVETTGYISTTFFALAAHLDRPELRERGAEMARWLCTVQRDDGSFGNERFNKASGIVFDTGQVLFGLLKAYQETHDDRFLDAANRAADWLVDKAADTNGKWTKFTHMGIPHVYNSRVAWALLLANEASPAEARLRVARSNLDWAVAEEEDGWFDQCAFTTGAAPFTHTIAYAIRGLWESSELLADATYREVAIRAAKAVAGHVKEDGFLAGQFRPNGSPAASYCCLTGNCQMAIIWAKLFRATELELFRESATRAIGYVMRTQDVSTKNLNIRGCIKGSSPIWGRYAPLSFPNWATKFFIDAVIECKEWIK